jgi:hypothetical protein
MNLHHFFHADTDTRDALKRIENKLDKLLQDKIDVAAIVKATKELKDSNEKLKKSFEDRKT